MIATFIRKERHSNVFKKWVNSNLSKRGLEVNNLREDLKDGIILGSLYEILSGENLAGKLVKPEGYLQSLSNLSVVLKPINDYIKKCNLGLTYSPNSILHGNSSHILGLLWVLMTKFVIIDSDSNSARKYLLQWSQKITKGYQNVKIKNFSRSFKNGLAFNAILDYYEPGIISFDKLSPYNAEKNLENAFNVAEKLGIPKLLEIADLEQPVPDERSVIAYVSTIYQFFRKKEEKKDEVEITEWLKEGMNLEECKIKTFKVSCGRDFLGNMEYEDEGNEKMMKLLFLMGSDSVICNRKKESEWGLKKENDIWRKNKKMEEHGDEEEEEEEFEEESDDDYDEMKKRIWRSPKIFHVRKEEVVNNDWDEEMKILESMGFSNLRLCKVLLEENNGDIQKLINHMYRD